MRRYIYLSLLTAMALAISLFESAMPLPFIAPGAKLGLSNIVILVSLVVFGFYDGFFVGVLKSILLMLVTGSVTSMIYSLAGAIGSVCVMFLAYKYLSNYLSLIGVSILGAATHNFIQISVAVLVTKTVLIYTYLPLLVGVGIFTGFFVGLASLYISKHLVKLGIGDKNGIR